MALRPSSSGRQLRVPATAGLGLPPEAEAMINDLVAQISAENARRTPDDEARHQLLLYGPGGQAVYSVTIDAAGALVATKVGGV
jgi:hypothetical protein